jgi:hypothetical protein
MDRLLQTFEVPFADANGDLYDVFLHGRNREHDTWQGWLAFTRRRDGRIFTTDVETTQPSSESVLYWATGLTSAYFDGAFDRARRRHQSVQPRPIADVAPPLRDVTADRPTYEHRLARLERDILHAFTRHAATQIATEKLMNDLPYAHADVVRALEHLEKRRHMLVRRTDGGNDWVILTYEGVRASSDEEEARG